MSHFLKNIFYISLSFLIIVTLYPGNLIGYLLYGDLYYGNNLIESFSGYDLSHTVAFFFVSFLGFLNYTGTPNFKKLVYSLFFLSITLELLHIIIPNRDFQLTDMINNILGVIVAYCIIKIYLLFIRHE